MISSNESNVKSVVLTASRELCPNDEKSDLRVELFSWNVQFDEAKLFCSQLGGKIPLPASENFFIDLLRDDKVRETFESSCSSTLWVPIVRSQLDSNDWKYIEDRGDANADFQPWERGQPNGYPRQNCTYANKNPNITYWDAECSSPSSQYCFACQFNVQVVFNLKGICSESSRLDTAYVLTMDLLKPDEFVLQGFSGIFL